MKTIMKKQRGAILVMTALLVILLLGMAALALDLGRLYVQKTEMQNAADTAARAGAMELDGESGALDRAEAAINDLLRHQAHFSREPELLDQLSTEAGSIIFYNWIGSSYDPAVPPCTPNADNKCVTTEDHDARYVEVRLYPELVPEPEAYTVDLFFLPVLGVLIDDVARVASVRARAVAGTSSEICNYPPIFMCSSDPSDPNGGMTLGQQVLVKVQKDSWTAGNFGFLETPGLDEDEGNQALAKALANPSEMGCTPSIVTTNPGNRVGWTRDGLNTRFGIYGHNMFMAGGQPAAGYEPAPNVIDYPRDRRFTAGRYGQGWHNQVVDSLAHEFFAPSAYSPSQYFETTQESGTSAPASLATITRYQLYQWELTGVVTPNTDYKWLDEYDPASSTGNLPSFNLDRADLFYTPPPGPAQPPPPYLPVRVDSLRQGISCNENDVKSINPVNHDCSLLDGDPALLSASYTPGSPRKRVLSVAMVDCEGLGGGKTSFDVLEHGTFIKMFLTEHIPAPAGGEDKVDVYAEYLGPVVGEELQLIIHRVIQLYE
ncbi:pilus assembly protein TadG-related protein [Desulfurivibrio sp. C05AmB]|uniref:pilus assembly protein TadG-related protein n=1 Tax=Desulfurivibrio sp. C05AmB TaxID=3374371 RepID=UPI00376EE234